MESSFLRFFGPFVYLIFLQPNFSLAQSRCEFVFFSLEANLMITQTRDDAHARYNLETLAHAEVIGLLGRPIRTPETIPGERPFWVGPVVGHRLHEFSEFYQNLMVELRKKSFDPSVLRRVREDREATDRFGVEVAQIAVEFRSGAIQVSPRVTSFRVDAIEDLVPSLREFLQNLPDLEITRVHLFHTHPSFFPAAGLAINRADVSTLTQLRYELLEMKREGLSPEAPFHLYAVSKSQNEIIIGHYSERGWAYDGLE